MLLCPSRSGISFANSRLRLCGQPSNSTPCPHGLLGLWCLAFLRSVCLKCAAHARLIPLSKLILVLVNILNFFSRFPECRSNHPRLPDCKLPAPFSFSSLNTRIGYNSSQIVANPQCLILSPRQIEQNAPSQTLALPQVDYEYDSEVLNWTKSALRQSKMVRRGPPLAHNKSHNSDHQLQQTYSYPHHEQTLHL